jgi:general stress protein 26
VKTDLETFYDMIDHIDAAMMTTRRADGHMQSRPMATQRRAPGADIWFVTTVGTPKLDDLARDPHVNLAYYNDSSRAWASVSGTAFVSTDRATIHTLYAPDWKLWFPDDGDDPRHGTPDDPRMVLIGVEVHAAVFLEVNKPKPVFLYEVAKGWLTGTEPELGTTHVLEEPHRPEPQRPTA